MERTESANRRSNVDLNELLSWKKDILMTKTNFLYDLAMMCIIAMNLRKKFTSFASRVNNTIKIIFKKRTNQLKKTWKKSMLELLWVTISSQIFVYTTFRATLIERWVKGSILIRFWIPSSSRDLTEMMISVWKKMMIQNTTLVKTISYANERKKMSWKVISTVPRLLTSHLLKIADSHLSSIFANFLIEIRSSR